MENNLDIEKLKKDLNIDQIEESSIKNISTIRKFSRNTTVLLSILVLGLLGLGIYDISLTTANEILTKGTYGSCHRLNIVRAVDNENFYNNYRVILNNAKRENNKITLSRVEKDKWIPLTNCISAVNHPFTYIPPEPIEFSKKIPSIYAFNLGPNN